MNLLTIFLLFISLVVTIVESLSVGRTFSTNFPFIPPRQPVRYRARSLVCIQISQKENNERDSIEMAKDEEETVLLVSREEEKKELRSAVEPSNEVSWEEKVDAFLDTPFFDPDADDIESQGPFQRWLANQVKSDYNKVETIFAGVYFVVLIVLTQELVRMQLYGQDYVPFGHNVKSSLW